MLNHPILFLDIDGVLCTGNHIWAGNSSSTFDAQCVSELYRIVSTTCCKIVISSTWRLYKLDTIYSAFAASCSYDLCCYLCDAIIGSTPILQARRGKEIQAWIDDNQFTGKFVIVDDDSDMEHLSHFLVKTKFATGLTKKESELAISMLQ